MEFFCLLCPWLTSDLSIISHRPHMFQHHFFDTNVSLSLTECSNSSTLSSAQHFYLPFGPLYWRNFQRAFSTNLTFYFKYFSLVSFFFSISVSLVNSIFTAPTSLFYSVVCIIVYLDVCDLFNLFEYKFG